MPETIRDIKKMQLAAELVSEDSVTELVSRAESPSTTAIGAGERVVLQGLKDAGGKWNGVKGVVVGWVADTGRWEVRPDGAEPREGPPVDANGMRETKKTINVKPENLVLLNKFRSSRP